MILQEEGRVNTNKNNFQFKSTFLTCLNKSAFFYGQFNVGTYRPNCRIASFKKKEQRSEYGNWREMQKFICTNK